MRITSTRKEKREQLFGNDYCFVKNNATERFSPYVDKRVKERITTERERLGISEADYLAYRLLSADMDDLLNLQYVSPRVIESCKMRTKVKRAHGTNGRFISGNDEVCPVDEEKLRCHRLFHRVSPQFKSEIKRRAKELGISESDYIVLVFEYYDFRAA